tara:strand:- start:104 stop:424 length:321 start_codon:yes stop_codon:yes gene_type:complete
MKRYSIPTKTKAKNLILPLAPIDTEIEWDKLTVTEKTHGIMIWGFEDKQIPILDADDMPTFNEDGEPLVDIIEGTTYNVDVVWKGEAPTAWEQYEINPLTPSHTVS